jgi:hypothetical protein
MTTIQTLQYLSNPKEPSREAAARRRTIEPMATRARTLRAELTALVAAHEDDAHVLGKLNDVALARVLTPDALAIVRRARRAAEGVNNAGRADDAMASVRSAEAGCATDTATEWDAHMLDVEKHVRRLDGAVAGLRRHVEELALALDQLGTVRLLVAETVTPTPRPGAPVKEEVISAS